jgi:hypothetical protein
MTEAQIRDLGPAFARYLVQYRPYLGREQNAGHFAGYCRGLLTDLPRKSVEPLALASGTAVRTLQEFLKTCAWDHAAVRDRLQRYLAGVLADQPDDGFGTIGIVDETSVVKQGDQTPGVRRQYPGQLHEIAYDFVLSIRLRPGLNTIRLSHISGLMPLARTRVGFDNVPLQPPGALSCPPPRGRWRTTSPNSVTHASNSNASTTSWTSS